MPFLNLSVFSHFKKCKFICCLVGFHLEIALNVPKYFLFHSYLTYALLLLDMPWSVRSHLAIYVWACGVSMNSCCHLYYGDIFYDQAYSTPFYPKTIKSTIQCLPGFSRVDLWRFRRKTLPRINVRVNC